MDLQYLGSMLKLSREWPHVVSRQSKSEVPAEPVGGPQARQVVFGPILEKP